MRMEHKHFTERENRGRIKLLKLFQAQIIAGRRVIRFTIDPYERYDFLMTSVTSTNREIISLGDIKDVNRRYDKFNNFQIDYDKLKNIVIEARKDDRTPLLVVFFEECVCIWDINYTDWQSRAKSVKCTSTTALNYHKGKTEKLETYLNKEEAVYVGYYE